MKLSIPSCLFACLLSLSVVNIVQAQPSCGTLSTPTFTSQSVAIQSATTGGVTINWSNVSAKTYVLSYKLASASQFTTACSGSILGCTINGLALGSTYNILLEASRPCNIVPGEPDIDEKSTTINVTLPSPAPSAPLNLVATSVSAASFVANWSASTGATSYRLDVSADASFSTLIHNNLTATTTSLAISAGLTGETTYFFRVRAVNATGTSGNSQSASVLTLPVDPPVLSATTSVTTSSFTANWNAVAGANSYRLDVSSDGFANFISPFNNSTVNGTSQSVTGLTPGTTYSIRVRAVNASGSAPLTRP